MTRDKERERCKNKVTAEPIKNRQVLGSAIREIGNIVRLANQQVGNKTQGKVTIHLNDFGGKVLLNLAPFLISVLPCQKEKPSEATGAKEKVVKPTFSTSPIKTTGPTPIRPWKFLEK